MKDTFVLEIRGDGSPPEVLIKNIVAVIHSQQGLAVSSVSFKFGNSTNYDSVGIPIPLEFSLGEVIMGRILSVEEMATMGTVPPEEDPEGYGPPEVTGIPDAARGKGFFLLPDDDEPPFDLEGDEAAAEGERLNENPSAEEERRETVITPDPVEVKLTNQG